MNPLELWVSFLSLFSLFSPEASTIYDYRNHNQRMAICDFNGDGYPDAARFERENNQIAIFHYNPEVDDLEFFEYTLLPALPPLAQHISFGCADSDSDGRAEIYYLVLKRFLNQNGGLVAYIYEPDTKGMFPLRNAREYLVNSIANIHNTFSVQIRGLSVYHAHDGVHVLQSWTRNAVNSPWFGTTYEVGITHISARNAPLFPMQNVRPGGGIRASEGHTNLVAGDFNGDRTIDYAAMADDRIVFHLSTNQSGAFESDQILLSSIGISGISSVSDGQGRLQKVDFNQDGKDDLLVGTERGIYVLKSSTLPGWGAQARFGIHQILNQHVREAPDEGSNIPFSAGDYNNDGYIDIGYLELPGRPNARNRVLIYKGSNTNQFELTSWGTEFGLADPNISPSNYIFSDTNTNWILSPYYGVTATEFRIMRLMPVMR